MLALICGLIEGSTAGWTALPIGCLAAGAVLLAGFGVRQRLAADPLILPSLLANRGIHRRLCRSAWRSSPPSTAWPTSSRCSSRHALRPQSVRGLRSPWSPLMAGIIVASIVCRPLVAKLGRVLVVIGLGITLAWRRRACGPRSWPKAPRSASGRL